MAKVHGKDGEVEVGANDISPHCNSIEWEESADVHDTTCFGATGHTKQGGLTDGKVSVKGIYDNTATTGPRDSVKAIKGTTVTFTYRPEGTGTGKPEDTCSVVVSSYKESTPVDDMISWEAEFEISGAVTSSDQS
jgi:hypothetical protein